MVTPTFSGQTILIAEGDLETALDLQDYYVGQGAQVFTAYRWERALEFGERLQSLSRVVVGKSFAAKAGELRRRLVGRAIPVICGAEGSPSGG